MVMIESGFDELVIFVFWFVGISLYFIMGMTNDAVQKPRSGRANGVISSSFRAFSSYMRIVSSGASTVARSAASVASSIVEKEDDANSDQVNWAGFDKLEIEGDVARRVLLLGYRSGFQVWDVEEANNIRSLVSRNDGPVSFMQMLPIPLKSKRSSDKFENSHPLLVLCTNGPNHQDRSASQGKMANVKSQDVSNVRFYSLKSQSYVHELKFQSIVYLIRCSSRVVAISQATQIHCFVTSTLEREYSILTNPIVMGCPSFGGAGYGPLAIGPRWLAYSGSPVAVTNPGHVSPQHLTTSANFPSIASNRVGHYAKESSKQLAQGLATIGDMGYKKLSRYYSELIMDSSHSLQSNGNGALNGHIADADNVGMVLVRDLVSKDVITQFRAHKSPISALCFDPSGTLLVTASVQGHNINVFKVMPGLARSSSASCAHLYRLQRGLTNAVIQDINFSDDRNWIMISSSRGTSHLFAINPVGGSVNLQSENGSLSVPTKPPIQKLQNCVSQMPSQQSLFASNHPLTLSAVSRIHNGNGWRGTVSEAAAAAAGRASPLSGAIASCFHNCKNNSLHIDNGSAKAKYNLLVFSPSGSMVQYALRCLDEPDVVSGLNGAYESAIDADSRLAVEAIRKWNICHRQNQREREDNIDIYGDTGNNGSYSKKRCTEETNGSPHFSEDSSSITEEKHHLYISEAELQMHQARSPLWAKPEIYFQSIMNDNLGASEKNLLSGEMEIETIPTRMIKARSKDLVPVFDYLPSPKPTQIRILSTDANITRPPPQQSDHPENGKHPCRSLTGSHDSASGNGAALAELQNGKVETNQNSSRIGLETGKIVNNNDSPKTQTRLEIVHNTESLKMGAQLKFVNNNYEGLKMENHFEDEGDVFD